MEGDFIKINEGLLPLSWLYGLAVKTRNFCFDVGLLRSRSFHVPVISVGNITVGGTGKTPHVEYLIRLLQKHYKVAVLSRGYKRKTKGYIVADENATARTIGDEPFQVKQKFPEATVAVCKKRTEGIDRLTLDDRELDVVLLDDAFQHRYVKPGINILLVDYHRLIIYDKLLPAGRLREPLNGKNRADIVIVTKCPKELKPMEFRVITKAMNLFPYQHLYFTTLSYDKPYPVFDGEQTDLSRQEGAHVMLLTCIASPRQLQEDIVGLLPESAVVSPVTFSDHHSFSEKDVDMLNSQFASMPQPRLVITTEKDAARLRDTDGLSPEFRKAVHALPVRIDFMQEGQQEMFDESIMGYVLKNSRNSILAKGKEKTQPVKKKNDTDDGPKKVTISFK
ncbi:MAG: tetraacyldisaccharide 4'-kinase [Prevotella sp.]|nr:tetraacyldisaccharide 4'-kinase [Prevotella sp.]